MKSKKLRPSQNNDVDQALLKWFKIQRANNIPISGSILQSKANDLAEKLGRPRDITSAWIQRFRQRHAITSGRISGEAAAVPTGIPEDWLNNVWPKLRDIYPDEKIYNADETGIFFKLTPEKTLRFKGEKCTGGKLSKDRLTVLVAVNMDGSDKHKLMVIGKSAKPRCFKNVNLLPVTYESNKSVWMTSELFASWLRKWDNELKLKNDKILLMVDNCPAHPHVENLTSINLVFLPPNTTSVLQPLDQDVIRSLKVNYRKSLILQIIQDLDEGCETKVSVLDAITMLERAWNEVTSITVKNCFRHAGFLIQSDNIIESACTEESLQEWGRSLAQPVSQDFFEEYEEVDKDLETTAAVSDEELLTSTLREEDDVTNTEKDNDNDEEINPPTLTEASSDSETSDSDEDSDTSLSGLEELD
ncbi:tigger transposable element-derived protein 4-like [Nilaparvata lugens]|uniref:tigger transposable element-derived protein 4-like n=1 Tax=Nilaparvata lugens TaxID=108931 RepID=UPI00193E8505|nr:tigger transposable element-derived protein 4-like [Nilaparvata lugens]